MKPFDISIPSSLVLGGTKKRSKTTTTTTNNNNNNHQEDEEERMALIDPMGRPTAASGTKRRKRTATTTTSTAPTTMTAAATIAAIVALKRAWTPTRVMRYLSLTALSAIVTFVVMRKEAKALHWQEFNHLLDPQFKTDQSHCYSERRHDQNQRCTCPDPAIPLPGTANVWKNHHTLLVKMAQSAPKLLDIVFVGDAIVERWQGTADLGATVLPDEMKQPFQSRFIKKNGADLEGLALGASSDTGPNLLWHIENGMIDSLNPKLWFISIGSNDLFEEKCTDRFVVASILNVVKAISDRKPDAHFIIHGILPRKDEAKSKTDFLKKKWKYAQMINTQIRKFCEHSPKLFYMQAGPLFLKEVSKDWKGRRSIDQLLLEDGVYPTKRGMEVWGDYIVKRVKQILKDIQAQETNGIKGVSRRLQIAATANSTKNGTMPTPNLQLER